MATADRISELLFRPIAGLFDIDHLQRIHRHIFQDAYAWAGQFRTVDLRLEGEFWFCRHEFIATTLADLFDQLRGEKALTDTTPQQFGARAGYYLSELNAIHPFREGNGRTQPEFIRFLGLGAGMDVDWRRATRAEMNAARLFSRMRARPTSFRRAGRIRE